MFYQGKKVLVTGGFDFIGAEIVKELLKQGARVRLVADDNQPLPSVEENIEIIRGDLAKQEDCQRAVRGINFVFHVGGPATGAAATVSNPMKSIIANLVLASQILNASWAAKVERFLLLSSTTVYPATDHPVKEEEIWDGPPHQSYFGYGWMRRYLEKLSEFVASKSDMKIAILRQTAIYGRNDDFNPATSHVVSALIRKAVEKQDPFVVWGTGNEMRDFIHVNDLARASLLLLEKYAVCDPVNIGYGKSITIKDIVKIILKAANYENANVIFDSSKPSTIPVRMVDVSKAERVIGFKPQISLEEGLADMVKWYAQTRKINLQINKDLMDISQLKEKAKYLRREAFEMVMNAGRGHLGGSLSCTEILTVLYYGGILKFDPKNPKWEGRDRFVLSKGHANNTFYALLADLGFYPKSELSKFTKDGGMLNGHCDNHVPGVDAMTGSLGHGLGIAAGMAMADKLNKKNNMVFAVLGDAECQEGSTWEAAMFANQHRLNNLVAFVDRNRLGCEDFTENTSGLEPVADKWKAFGWETRVVDGHSFEELFSALKDCRERKSAKPLAIIANTIKGKGISSLENNPKSHHTLPAGEEINIARKELQ